MKPEQVFKPEWPAGLRSGRHDISCDDEPGREFSLVVEEHTGDIWMGTADKEEGAHAIVRVRTFFGGGRNLRTHQALLWLALAMQLDRKEPRR